MNADVLVLGAGPAALTISSALTERGLAVEALTPTDPQTPWSNTYGIWGEEVDQLGLAHLLSHRWSNTVSWFAEQPTQHGRDYGLFDKQALQQHLLDRGERSGLKWRRGLAAGIDYGERGSLVTTRSGERLEARLVVDATGHQPVFVRRPLQGPVAGQAAYGIVATFSAPPVDPDQFVLMDYRVDHLSAEERAQPPSFLYAMDLGGGSFFVEETSLALAPALSFEVLHQRLERRLAHRGVKVQEIQHVEHCLFPMNPSLPFQDQRVVGFGGSASMVHPSSGYLVGGLLRRAPDLAAAIARGLAPGGDTGQGTAEGGRVAAMAWEALWPPEMRRKHALYRFGLEKLMRFPESQLRHFFRTFFSLPSDQWYGFLTNSQPLPELLGAMLRLFAMAPGDVRWGLMEPQGRELSLIANMLVV
jgi:lycopene beta-cyclase